MLFGSEPRSELKPLEVSVVLLVDGGSMPGFNNLELSSLGDGEAWAPGMMCQGELSQLFELLGVSVALTIDGGSCPGLTCLGLGCLGDDEA